MRKLILIFLIGLSLPLFAQVALIKYLVKFNNKSQSPYSLSQPEEFLSSRAIERRTRQGIEIDVTDIPIDPAYIQGVIGTGVKLIIQVKWINAVIIQTNSQLELAALQSLPYVLSIEPVNSQPSVNKSSDKFKTEESVPFKSNSYDPTYGDAFNQIDMVNGIPLHDAGFKGDGMVIAVLDAGFTNANVRTIFSSLWNNNQILGSYNFVDPSQDVFRYHTHGTMVLSMMGGSIPGSFLGTAPKASYWLLLTEESPTEFLIEEYNWIAGAAFADSVGADIINSSLGYTEFDNPIYNHSYSDLDGNTTPVTKGADLAAAKGILVVNSAGNEGANSWKYLIAPADGDSVLTVGSVNANETISSFSSYGFESDTKIKPNIVAQGGSDVLANASADDLTTGSGTSFSSPLIAGMMACLWQTNPTASNMDLIKAVEQSSSRYLNPDNRYGYGIPDFSNAKLLLGVNNNLNVNNSFQILPNPVKNTTIIRWDQAKNNFEWLELIDIQGRVLNKVKLIDNRNQYILSLENYSNGIYFLRLGNQNQSQSQKILKIY